MEFLKPSGYTGASNRAGEPGSNGLLLDARGRLVLCQHGDRRIARLEPDWTFHTLARFRIFRFNSPNDAVYRSNGDLYFTDPPYGLEKLNDDPAKELMFSGVFRLTPNGQGPAAHRPAHLSQWNGLFPRRTHPLCRRFGFPTTGNHGF